MSAVPPETPRPAAPEGAMPDLGARAGTDAPSVPSVPSVAPPDGAPAGTDVPSVPSVQSVALERRLGPLDASAIIVSNVIGGGILFTPPQVAAAVPNPWGFLGAWLAGGALAFAGAMAYAELAALRPRAGGEYVYLRAAYGRLAGFLTGWTSFVAGFSGAMAASAVVLVFYLNRFVPGAADPTPLFVIPLPLVPLTVSRQALVAIAAVVLMAWVHLRGVGPGRIVSNVLAVLKVAALLVFIAIGFSIGAGSGENLRVAAAPVAATAWLLALVPVMFTYSGWNAAAYMAEEIRDPGRNVPLALGLGTIAVIAIYFLLNLLYLYVLPVDALAAVQGSVLDVIADRLLGGAAGDIMGVVSIVSLLASISAMTFAGPRVYYAMARDHLFFAAAGRVHPTYRTPAWAIIAQAAWTSLLILSGGADALTRYTGFAVVLFAGVAVAALFVLRFREPDAPRPFKALGYPLAPAIFTLASFAIVVNAIWTDPVPSGAGVIVMAAGIPLFWWFGRSRIS
ncbi:MAG: APC family permease [Vicinamibacterales bacterium]